MDWLVATPAALAAPRRAGLTTPDKEDLVILPLGGEQLFVMSYHGSHLHGDIYDVAVMKEALLRPGVAPGAVAVLVTDDHEECGTGHLVGWLERLARERRFNVSVFFVPRLTAPQVLDQLRVEASAFLEAVARRVINPRVVEIGSSVASVRH